MTRTLATILALVLLTSAACGGRAEIYDRDADTDSLEERAMSLPDPVPATPVFVATTERALSDGQLERLDRTPGAAVVAPVTIERLQVEGPGGRMKLRVGQVEPMRFRPVAPSSTRDADFVWISLMLGQVVPTADAAEKLGLDGGGELAIDGDPGYKIGAFADNGVPNLADILLPLGGERTIDIGRPTTFVIGAETGVTIQRLRRDLRARLPGARLRRLIPQSTAPAPPTSTGGAAVARQTGVIQGGVVGTMRFQVLEGGFIRPDPGWVSANIVRASVPILGTVMCHRLMIPRLSGALSEIEREGLGHLIKPREYGGCYVPRFIDRNPGLPLSNHAFGLAVDLNVPTNQLGTRGDMDPGIIAIFNRWGFTWGGIWSRPDPMHFELTG
jgi:hypothetical protein